jgi:hypothetical protein
MRAASARKEELRQAMVAVPIAHLAEVGRAAAREEQRLGSWISATTVLGTPRPGAESEVRREACPEPTRRGVNHRR